MLRVVLGRARPDTEWSGKISDIQFNAAPGVQESMRSRGATSTILTVPRSHHGEEVDMETSREPKPKTEHLDEKAGMDEREAKDLI